MYHNVVAIAILLFRSILDDMMINLEPMVNQDVWLWLHSSISIEQELSTV